MTNTRSSVEVSTRTFYASHACEPRGEGSWAFFIQDAIFWAPYGSYSSAKKAAVAEARRVGAFSITVAP